MSKFTLCGKRDPYQLNKSNENFDGYELFLTQEHLNNYDETINLLEGNNIESVHTTHSKTYEDFQKSIRLCDNIANKFNAKLVIHSAHIKWNLANYNINFNLKSEYGLENYIGLSVPVIERSIINKDHNMILDTGHLYITNPDIYIENLEYILDKYSGVIPVIHLCDSNFYDDNLNLGEGSIDIDKTLEIILNSNYEGVIVLEVPVNEQKYSKKYLNENSLLKK